MELSVSRLVRYPNLEAIREFLTHPNRFEGMGFRRVVRMRDDFLDAASHELKTPLTSLRLQVQLISRMTEKREDAVSPEKLKLLVEDADRQITRMTELINRMLDASGMRAGKLELKYEEMELTELLRSEIALFQADPAFCHLDIRLDAPQAIRGSWDRARVAQVLKSLLSNAAQYGLRRPIDVAAWADRSTVRISVRDRGIGIPEENQERIFCQFERCVPGEKFNGMGLGLFISRQIALAHKGTIDVKSKPGDGSIFTLKLPLKPGRRLKVVK